MLKNYLAPVGKDITKEYLPCSLSPSFGDYHLDYMVAENASGKKFVAWPGRVSRPVTGIGTTLFATSDSGMSVERRNGSFTYTGGTGSTTWGTHYANQLILGLKDKYSTNVDPGDTVPYMKIVQSETYSLIQPLLTRCDCEFVTQQQLYALFSDPDFQDCCNCMYINTNLTTLEVGAGMLLSANSALAYPKMVVKYAIWQGNSWTLSYPNEATLTKYFEQNGSHYYYASLGLDIDQGSFGMLVIGFPYAYFEKTNDVNTNGFRASLNSVYLHIV